MCLISTLPIDLLIDYSKTSFLYSPRKVHTRVRQTKQRQKRIMVKTSGLLDSIPLPIEGLGAPGLTTSLIPTLLWEVHEKLIINKCWPERNSSTCAQLNAVPRPAEWVWGQRLASSCAQAVAEMQAMSCAASLRLYIWTNLVIPLRGSSFLFSPLQIHSNGYISLNGSQSVSTTPVVQVFLTDVDTSVIGNISYK